jgi:hypothetical protein
MARNFKENPDFFFLGAKLREGKAHSVSIQPLDNGSYATTATAVMGNRV